MRRAQAALLAATMAAACSARVIDPRATDDAGAAGPPAADADVDASSAEAASDAPADAGAADVDGDTRGGTGGDVDADAGDADHGVDGVDGAPDPGIDCATDAGHPVQLGCTGLYSSWPARTLAPDVRAYTPGLVLWSDGAAKSRYIRLPPGTAIDTSNMDEWTFPVGTKLWKEFRVGGARVETRFLWKRGPGDWFRTTYAWSADGSSATELTTGVPNVNGTGYEIPPQSACTACHQGRIDFVLGFEAVSLAAPGATGLTLQQLVNEGLLTSPPSAPLVVPGNATESAAIGWLHANCGTACHNRSPRSLAGSTGLYMRLDVGTLGSVQTTDVWSTAVGQPSSFQPTPNSNLLLIAPGNPSGSAIYFRDSYRDTQGEGFQMPPLDTHAVPTAGVALVRSWILSMASQ
jgi:hypothetical protein